MTEPLRRPHDTRPLVPCEMVETALVAGAEVVARRLPDRPRWQELPGWTELRRLFHGFGDIERRAALARLILEESERLRRDAGASLNGHVGLGRALAEARPGATSGGVEANAKKRRGHRPAVGGE